ncbi:hypothetical protein QTP70_020619, partial [Hemibagrus guttatus]
KEGTVVKQQQGHGLPRLIEEQRLARVVRSNRRATVAQIAEEVNAGSERKHLPKHCCRPCTPFKGETLFPDGCGLFQQDNAPCHKAEMVQEWFDDHNNQFEELTPPPNSPDLNPIQHLWDVLEKTRLSGSEARLWLMIFWGVADIRVWVIIF